MSNHQLHRRIENQIHLILLEMEEQPDMFGLRDRLAVVTTVGMYLKRDQELRKSDEPASSGTAIRKYAGAFKTTNVAGGGKTNARSVPAAITDDYTTDPESDT